MSSLDICGRHLAAVRKILSDWSRIKEDFRKIISRERVKIQTGGKQ